MIHGCWAAEINWDAVVSGVFSALALLAAVWLGLRQIGIASRQADIAAEQARIAGHQNSISERQTTIMESQANLERFHAMRDDLTIMLDTEEFLHDLKMSVIYADWRALGKAIPGFRKVEITTSRVVNPDIFDGIGKALDHCELLYDTRTKLKFSVCYGNDKYKHRSLMKGIYLYPGDIRTNMIVIAVKDIDAVISQIKGRRIAIYEILHRDNTPY